MDYAKLVSLISLFLSFPLLFFQLTTLPVLLIREYRPKLCFRVMFTLGIADSLQLLISLVISALVLLDVQAGNAFERICGAIMQLSWDVVIFHHLLLSSNRFLIFVKAAFMPAALTKQPKWERHLFNLLLGLIWALFLTMLCAFQTPFLGVNFVREYAAFMPDMSLPWMDLFRHCEFYWSCALPTGSLIFYISIVFLLRKSRKKSNTESGSSSPLSKQELRILCQSLAMFAMMTLLITVWNLMDLISWDPPQSVYLANLVVFLLFCGVNPLLYLTTNPEFRQHYGRLYFSGCAVAPTSTSSPGGSLVKVSAVSSMVRPAAQSRSRF